MLNVNIFSNQIKHFSFCFLQALTFGNNFTSTQFHAVSLSKTNHRPTDSQTGKNQHLHFQKALYLLLQNLWPFPTLVKLKLTYTRHCINCLIPEPWQVKCNTQYEHTHDGRFGKCHSDNLPGSQWMNYGKISESRKTHKIHQGKPCMTTPILQLLKLDRVHIAIFF